MSNFAIFCLVIGAIFGAFLIIEPQVAEGWYIAAQAGLVICGLAFIGAMLIGRRIKFDPVLR
ncbi:PA3371 family protein [Stutzerimonas stutzeri]|uniref:PA3371 family protein n=1 Tax=Stutzerimonas stutzeri TaxID=316 RepID=UPI001BCEB61C|nr:PA3371 family protein [Stutzerimonas stutzeri]